MSDLLNRETFATIMGQDQYLDAGAYRPGYLAAVFAAVQAEIAAYLMYDPALGLRVDEEGPVDFASTGPYAGRYLLQLKHRPLVPGTATDVFSSLQLGYALAFVGDLTDVALEFVTLIHATGQVYCLAPGAVEALAPSIGFAFAPTPGLRAVSFRASYASGFSTGINESLRSGSTSYNAPPLPEDIRLGAAYLCAERLQMRAAQQSLSGVVTSGMTTSIRVGERAQTFQPMTPRASGQWSLGFGGPLSQTAQQLLLKHRRTPVATLIG